MFSDEHITQKYLRRYGMETKRAKSWAGRMVHIRTNGSVWRIDAKGYTLAGKSDAWILPFEEAVKRISHCGPEKYGSFWAAKSFADVTAEEVERIGLEHDRFETGIGDCIAVYRGGNITCYLPLSQPSN